MCIRDRQSIRPDATERLLKRFSYGTTILVGVLATIGALYPPQFLQYLIVFTGGGLAVAFLAPVALGLYWPRFNKSGAIMSMVFGIVIYVLLYLIGFVTLGNASPIRPLELDPFIWGFLASLLAAWFGTRYGHSNSERALEAFFGKNTTAHL